MILKKRCGVNVLAILLLFSTYSFAQKQTISLETHLKKIEDFFKVSFNYESSLLKNKICTDCFYNEKTSLKTHFEYLESHFMLSFRVVTKSKIVIKPLKKKILYFYDSDDNTPLEHVLITDLNKHKTWVTNKEGKVFFEDVIPNKISISHLSYGKQNIDVNKLNTNKVYVNKQIQGLEVLFIYPFFSTGTYKKNDGAFFIKTKEVGSLAGLTSHDVIKNLENLPQVTSNSESISDLIVKGSTQDQNLFVWNDIKVYQNSHFFGLISAFNENLLSTITLYDNATPAEYGNSTSSVISLEHDTMRSKKIKGGLGINFLSADGYVKIPINKKSELLLSTRKSLTDVWDSPTYLNYAKKAFQSSDIRTFNTSNKSPIDTKNTFDFHDSQLQYKLAINESNNIGLNVLILANNLSYIETNNTLNTSKESTLTQENTALGFNWQHTFSNNSQIETVINYSKYKLDGGNFLLSRDISSFQSNSVRNYETALKYSSSHKTLGVTYEAGISHEHLTVVNNINNFNQFFQSNTEQQSNIYGLFGTLNYYKNKIEAGLNLRNVYYEFLKSFQTEPRFHLTYHPIPEMDIQLRGEIKTQNISQVINLENNFLGIEKRRWFLANDSIAPLQKSKQLELSFGFKKRRHMLSTSIYAKKVKGITTNNQGFQNLNQFDNLFGSYVIKGYTFHYNYKSHYLNTWLSYNYSTNKYKFKDKSHNTFHFYNNNDMRHSLIFGVKGKYKLFNFSLGMEYNSGKPYTSINKEFPIIEGPFNTINYNEPNAERLSDYLRFDASMSYDFDISKKIDYKLTVGLINIGSKKNILNRYYTLTEDKKDIEVLDRYGLEFTPNVSLNIDF